MVMTNHPLRRLRLVDAASPKEPTLRIGVATSGRGVADGAFGRAPMFAIYQVGADASCLVEVLEFTAQPRRCAADNDNPNDCDDRLAARIAALSGCQVVFARQMGDAAAAAAMKAHVHPVELTWDEPIAALLRRCQSMLATNPPPWLRRAAGAASPEDIRRNRTESVDDVHGGALSPSAIGAAIAGR